MEIEKVRKEIDQIDAEIIQLLNKRMETALRTKNLKEGVEDAKREEEIIKKLKETPMGLIRGEFTERIFKEIIKKSKELQKENLKVIGFQGEHGAYSEVAIRDFDSASIPIPYPEFVDVFEGVESGQLDLGAVPVENSRAGPITEVDDLLIKKDLKVVAEMNCPVHHCLLTLPDTDYRDIKVVYSHPQAIAQCRGFITRNKMEAKQYYDTAGAAMMLARDRPAATAVIASRLCAELYNLEIVKENIEDQEQNQTRFLIISRDENKEDGDKCSIIFSTAHKAGALFRVLAAFSDAKINLTRIESRPIESDPGKYAFLLDFQGSKKDKEIVETLEKIKSDTDMLKFLGCYKEAKK